MVKDKGLPMQKRKFGPIKTLSIPARLRIAGAFATIGVLVTCYAGFSGLTQSNLGLVSSINATSAVVASMDGDMMRDALRADVFNAMVQGPEASAADAQQILDDVDKHSQRFLADLHAVTALPIGAAIQTQVANTLPLAQIYVDAAGRIARTGLKDCEKGKKVLPAFLGVLASWRSRRAGPAT